MKQTANRFIVFLFILITICTCGQSSLRQDSNAKPPITTDIKLTIDTFSTFPNEIDGCSCYFSNNSKEFQKKVYIYINDYAQTYFLKVNGKLTKFKQTEYKNIDDITVEAKGKSDDYELTIKVVHVDQSGDESSLKSGTIILSDKKGNRITRIFFGECGC